MPDDLPSEHPAIALGYIVVQSIVRDEKDVFQSLLARHHYLDPASLIGQPLQYLACVQDR